MCVCVFSNGPTTSTSPARPRWRVAFGPAGVDPAMRTSQLSVENLLALSDVLDELSGRAKPEVAASSGNVDDSPMGVICRCIQWLTCRSHARTWFL